jgi:2',3'-cyclic-nucleotide 2'-phosphodiesterase (5'-nucleotidase family)
MTNRRSAAPSAARFGGRAGAAFALPLLALAALLALAGPAAVGPVPASARPAGRAGDGVQRLHLLWTNDLHGHIAPEGARFMNPNFPPPLGGAASAAAYIKRIREEAAANGEAVMLIDVGDMFQGTPVGTKTQGTAVIDYFNSIGYDLAVPGNHDFDLGRENAARLAKLADFPWLCANLVEQDSREIVDWCRPTLMLERGGLKIGVVGIITPATIAMSFPANIAGLAFLPMAETVARYRDELREQGADLVLLAIHEGLPRDALAQWRRQHDVVDENADRTGERSSYGTASGGHLDLMGLVGQVPGIDIAVGGHTHQGYPEPWVDPVNHTICFETFGNGSSLGHAILEVDRQTRTLLGWKAPHDRGTIVTLFEDEIWPDPATAEVIRPHRERTEAEMGRVLGRLAANAPRGGPGANLVGNLVTDAMLDHFQAEFAVQNLGGLRADLVAGDVTARDVFSVLPFGNDVVVAQIPGDLLRRILERKVASTSSGLCIAGGEVVFNSSRPDGERLCRFTIGGQPLDPQRKYRVAVSSYLMAGNSGMDLLTTVPETDVELTQITDAEALEAYLGKHSPVRPRLDDRWVEDKGCAREPYLAAPVAEAAVAP